MVDPAFAALFVAPVVQFSVAVIVHPNAHPPGRPDPATYGVGIAVPAADFVAVLYSLPGRKTPPSADGEES